MIAAVSKDTASFPLWWGTLDVSIAFVLAILTFVIYGLAHGKVNKQIEETTYRVYRVLIHGIFFLILIFFLLGSNHLDQWLARHCVAGLVAPLYPAGVARCNGNGIRQFRIEYRWYK
jgi:hypothetical protein